MHYFGFLPMEVRPDIGTTLAAHLSDDSGSISDSRTSSGHGSARGSNGRIYNQSNRSAARERLMRALRRA